MERVLCLLYHRVSPVKDDMYHLTVSPYNFEEQIRYLKEQVPILRFEEDWTKPGQDGVAITFDDGYADNYEYALPILEKYRVPATIFISTGYVGSGQEYWWDGLVEALTRDIEYPEWFELKDTLYHYKWETHSLQARREMVRSLHWMLKLDPDVARANLWLEQIRSWAGIRAEARKEHLPVDRWQLQELSRSKFITIGAHTVNHRSLGAQPKEGQQYEIGASICFLEKTLKKKIYTFSYPFGSAVHFNPDTLEICRQKGIVKAATTIKGLWKKTTNPFTVPRVEVKDEGRKEFEQFMERCWERDE